MARIIIIGLGGCGSEIVAKIQDILDIQSKQHPKLKDYIQLAIVDTDVNAINERTKKGFRGAIVQISANMTVQNYLHYDQASQRWFPKCRILGTKTLTEGAAQVRAISRLSLNTALKNGSFAPLYTAIDRMYFVNPNNLNDNDQATRVIIVSSLAGGTGSGIYLPLAMYLRNYLKRKYHNTEPIFKGFFVMPSIFEDAISSLADPELISMCANGYASLKELNAFTMLRDGQISASDYPNLKIDLIDEYGIPKTYRESPYNMCFLFEKNNDKSLHLKDFDESENNIARCIWMQALNPLSVGNSSIEDNNYKSVASGNPDERYERFAGMGISSLEYPYKELSEYLSIVMAKNITGENWYAIDKEYQKELDSGISCGRDKFYLDSIRNLDSKGTEWKVAIRRAQDGKWIEKYLKAVEDLIEKEKVTIPEKEDILARSANVDNWPGSENAMTNACKQFESSESLNQESVVRHLWNQLKPIEEEGVIKKTNTPYQLTSWIGCPSGQWNTPIENRYFLYEVERRLREIIQKSEERIKSGIDNQSSLNEQRNIKQQEFETARNNFISQEAEKNSFWGKLHSKKKKVSLPKNISGVRDAFCSYCTAMENLFYEQYRLEVYQKLLAAVKKISRNYERLLDQYNELSGTRCEIMRSNMEQNFNRTKGILTRSVCTSKKCLDRMEKMVTRTEDQKESQNQFAKTLLLESIKYTGKQNDSELLKFWYELYNQHKAQKRLDVDIMTALKNEAVWENGLSDGVLSDEEYVIVQEYIRRIIVNLRDKITTAFIQLETFKERHVMEMNIYPESVPKAKTDARLAEIVRKELHDKHGVIDDSEQMHLSIQSKEGSPKYRIDFYRAFFGVSAGELAAFLNGQEDSVILSGECYDAYQKVVAALDWENNEENFLTPHIDHSWHMQSEMPDLSIERDEANTIMMLKSLLYALVRDKDPLQKVNGEYCFQPLKKRSYQRLKPTNFYDLTQAVMRSPYIIYTLKNELEMETEYGAKPIVHWDKIDCAELLAYAQTLAKQGKDENYIKNLIREAIDKLIFDYKIKPYNIRNNLQHEIEKTRTSITNYDLLF